MSLPEPLLVHGLFARGLGLVFLVAFASLRRDVIPHAGEHGITPLAPVLRAIRRDYPGLRRFLRFPTLFWLGASDRALRGGTTVGMVAACLIVLGVASGPAFALCWVLYLSYAVALDYFYPWDLILLEAGALALFLPDLAPLPELAALEAPLAPIAWAYRWMLFRVVFGFGKYKFFGPGTLHTDYLRSFLISQPLSTPIALLAGRLPRFAFPLALGLLFLIEVPTPFLIFGPAPARLFAMGAVAVLMVGIQLCGNFGFFNLVVLVLVIPLLDAHGSLLDASLASLVWPLDHALATVLAAFLFLGGLVSLPFNSWIAQAWPSWPALERVRGARWLTAMLRAVAPFHLVHAFGVFSPESGPPLKWVPVLEGTRDGLTWEPYRYRYMPSGEDSPGRFIAPCMPRFDHALIYEALGISLSNLTASVFAAQNPYRFSRTSWMERLAQRLLEGRPEVRALFLSDPFEDEPPIAVRARLTTLELDSDGARIWKARDVGTHLPAQRLEPLVFERSIPTPELFHWDERASRRQSAVWRERMAAEEEEVELERLFGALVPLVARHDLAEPGALGRVEAALEHAFDVRERDALEALVARVAWRLATAFEATGAKESWFDLGLLAHDAVLRGRAFVDAASSDPAAALEALRPVDLERGLRLWAAFRPEVLRFSARKARVRELTLRGAARRPHPIAPGFLRHLPELGRFFPDETESLTRYRREGDAWVSDADRR